MIKVYCDVCGKEIEPCNIITDFELCNKCKRKVKKYIKELKGKVKLK